MVYDKVKEVLKERNGFIMYKKIASLLGLFSVVSHFNRLWGAHFQVRFLL